MSKPEMRFGLLKARDVTHKDSLVNIWTMLRAGRILLPAEKRFSLLHSVQTGSGAHPVSYAMAPGSAITPPPSS
jgi:hypothetical protein